MLKRATRRPGNTGYFLLPLLTLLLNLAGSPAAARDGDHDSGRKKAEYAADAVLVAFHEAAPFGARLAAVQQTRLMVDPAVRSPYFARLRIPRTALAAGATVESVLRGLRKDPSVRVAEPDWILHADAMPNDANFGDQWGMHNAGQDGGKPGADIHAPEAWSIATGSAAVKVAVIDTGVDYTHPDLRDNILRDATGRVVGYDFANGDADPMDDHGHGTHCAGTIGARGNNALGIAGVCWNVKIMPMKFLDSEGRGTSSDAIQCIDWARQHGAQIMSNSWGGDPYSQLLLEAIQRTRAAGILFVASAGNNGSNNDVNDQYPANYNRWCDSVIAVAATDRNDKMASFSDYGTTTVDIAAPGVDIASTTPNGTYDSWSGTSMAAPHVAGSLALLKAKYPTADYRRLKAVLLLNADPVDAIAGKVASGRLNIDRAIRAGADAVPPGTPSPLAITHRGATGLRVQWKASGDDGTVGAALKYDVRVSPTPMTTANFDAAPRVATQLKPAAAGATQSLIIPGLYPATSYYVALRAMDEGGNVSAITFSGRAMTLPAPVVLSDNVEGTLRFSSSGTSPWAVTSEDYSSATRSYTDSPGGTYNLSEDKFLTQNAAVTLGAGTLIFRAKIDLERDTAIQDGDHLYVEVSSDNGAHWVRQGEGLTGTSAGWQTYAYPLTGYEGKSVRVRFRLTTDEWFSQNDGVHLDDIRIISATLFVTPIRDDAEGTAQFAGPSPWARTTEDFVSGGHSYAASPGAWYAYDRGDALAATVAVPLTGFAPTLSFRARVDTEDGGDFVFAEASSDGGAIWRRLLALSGFIGWRNYSLPLTDFDGKTVRVRFHLVTNEEIPGRGIWIDDIVLGGEKMAVVPAPAAPTGLTVTGRTRTQISLTWTDNSPDEDGFAIERQTAGGAWTEIARVGRNVRTYSSAGLLPNTAYAFRVRAFNYGGASAYTNTATTTTLP